MKQIITLAIIAAFAAALTATAEIQSAKGGANQLLNTSVGPATSVESAPAPAMACPKCGTVRTTHANVSRGGVMEYCTAEQHVCPGCSTRIGTTGDGKARTDSVTHTCSLADNKGAGCCK